MLTNLVSGTWFLHIGDMIWLYVKYPSSLELFIWSFADVFYIMKYNFNDLFCMLILSLCYRGETINFFQMILSVFLKVQAVLLKLIEKWKNVLNIHSKTWLCGHSHAIRSRTGAPGSRNWILFTQNESLEHK